MQNLLSGSKHDSWLNSKLVIIVSAAIVVGVVAYQQGWLPKLSISVNPTKTGVVSQDQEEASDYTAVYLDNNQVFYGKQGGERDGYLILTDAYYYQPGVRSVKPGTIRIVKVGTELHEPKDEVSINTDRIVMIQSLSLDSKIVKAIGQYKEGQSQ